MRSKVAPRATETAKIETLRRILGQHKKVLDVQGAILVVKGEARTTAAVVVESWRRLVEAWRRMAKLAGEGFGLPRDTIQVSHSLTKVRGLRQTI